MAEWGEKPFRTKQVWEWLWAKRVDSIDAMSNLPAPLRQHLSEHFCLRKPSVAHRQESRDGSVKYGFQLYDGSVVEGVLIPAGDNRSTACVSSQVGCSLTCRFCATGYMNLKRNLDPWEITDQIDLINRESLARLGHPLTNVVYMGMGEPLLNYRNVMASLHHATSPDGLGLSPRRITVSTAGIAKMIKKLADDGFRCEFALSLHAANDEKRNTLMPINESNTLDALADALRYFYAKTKTRVTFEYIIFNEINDTTQDARELAAFARCVPCKINVIEYNPIREATYRNTTDTRMQQFIGELERHKFIVNVRRSRGKDVDGGCGQLALKTNPN
jgi:23S rRNA (adenine2503-C2)-methyltransferase